MPKNRPDPKDGPQVTPVMDYYADPTAPEPQIIGEHIAKALPTLGNQPPGAMRDRMPRLGDEPAPGDAARKSEREPYGKDKK
jgi:hypothetical protein